MHDSVTSTLRDNSIFSAQWITHADDDDANKKHDINTGYTNYYDSDFKFNVTVNGTTEEKSFYLNVVKMSEMLENQNVVATCRYVLFKYEYMFAEASAKCHALPDFWPISVVGRLCHYNTTNRTGYC
eukprot:sb/3475478/